MKGRTRVNHPPEAVVPADNRPLVAPIYQSVKFAFESLEETLHPWVAFGVAPLFAFANAGVSLAGFSISNLIAPIPLGIALGLFLGKQIGIFGTVWVAIKAGVCSKPEGASWPHIYGVAVLGGIGFTMSLFIGALGFAEAPVLAEQAKMGVLLGSALSGITGVALLLALSPRR